MIVLLLHTAAAAPAVAVPTVDVPPGGVLTGAILEERPLARLPGSPTPLRAVGQLAGRTPRERLLAGEPVREERLVDPEAGFGMQALLASGHRAVRVEVGSVLGVEVGNHVRLVETFRPPGAEAESLTLGATVPVLAVDPQTRTVIVDVTPEVAQHLARPLPRMVTMRGTVDATGVERHGELAIDDPSAATGVVVARRELRPGLPIGEEDLVRVDARVDGGLGPEWVVGRYVSERILAGEPIRSERLADPEAGYGLHAILPRGMVAAPVPYQGAEGMVAPGNYVDLAVSVPELRQTLTLLQAVFVLAVGPEDVTLLVTPDWAEKVAHAFVVGSHPTLLLRNDLDVEIASLPVETWSPPIAPATEEPVTKTRKRRAK